MEFKDLNYKRLFFRIFILFLVSLIILILIFNPFATYCRDDKVVLNSNTTNILLDEIKSEMMKSSLQIFLSFPFEYKKYDLILRDTNSNPINPHARGNFWLTFLFDNQSYNVYLGEPLKIKNIPFEEEHSVVFSNSNANIGGIGGDYQKFTNNGQYMEVEGPNVGKIDWSYEICITKSKTETIKKLILILIIMSILLPSLKSIFKYWTGSRDY
ncbi:MAG: hypothetical protein WC438_03975 [Candidatus Pacearchaeota archaeon]